MNAVSALWRHKRSHYWAPLELHRLSYLLRYKGRGLVADRVSVRYDNGQLCTFKRKTLARRGNQS